MWSVNQCVTHVRGVTERASVSLLHLLLVGAEERLGAAVRRFVQLRPQILELLHGPRRRQQGRAASLQEGPTRHDATERNWRAVQRTLSAPSKLSAPGAPSRDDDLSNGTAAVLVDAAPAGCCTPASPASASINDQDESTAAQQVPMCRRSLGFGGFTMGMVQATLHRNGKRRRARSCERSGTNKPGARRQGAQAVAWPPFGAGRRVRTRDGAKTTGFPSLLELEVEDRPRGSDGAAPCRAQGQGSSRARWYLLRWCRLDSCV